MTKGILDTKDGANFAKAILSRLTERPSPLPKVPDSRYYPCKGRVQEAMLALGLIMRSRGPGDPRHPLEQHSKPGKYLYVITPKGRIWLETH